jgi:HD-GYP domain-containing protein (c-di-GMP phosphodiesterase class II)
MDETYYRPIILESITPENFPDIALYVKGGQGNFILFKNQEIQLTKEDLARFKENGVEFLYLRDGDMPEISRYMENNLSAMFERDDIDKKVKETILYQTSLNFINDVFKSPSHEQNFERCRNIVNNIVKYMTRSMDSLDLLQTMVGNYYYIFIHSVQVATLSLLVHELLYTLAGDELVDVGIGTILHDIGMTSISADILNKTDSFSDYDYQKIKLHPQQGFNLLKQMSILEGVPLSIVRNHHEKYDGSGYPQKISGNSIPRSAQITAICDIYCALTTDRPYRKASPSEHALKIMEESIAIFNPELFKRFKEIVTSGSKGHGL